MENVEVIKGITYLSTGEYYEIAELDPAFITEIESQDYSKLDIKQDIT